LRKETHPEIRNHTTKILAVTEITEKCSSESRDLDMMETGDWKKDSETSHLVFTSFDHNLFNELRGEHVYLTGCVESTGATHPCYSDPPFPNPRYVCPNYKKMAEIH